MAETTITKLATGIVHLESWLPSTHLILGQGTDICIAPHSQKLTTEALSYGSHSFYATNTPNLPLIVRSPDGATTE